MKDSDQITELLEDWKNGRQEVLEVLMPLVEAELRIIAHNFMRREKHHHTLQTTALINEAYLKLIDQNRTEWQNRRHFFAVSAKIMRRILINYARDSRADKRGGKFNFIALEDSQILTEEKSSRLIALDEALQWLAEFDDIKSQIVELRSFGGLTIEETAKVLNVSTATVSLHWRTARALLQSRMEGKGEF